MSQDNELQPLMGKTLTSADNDGTRVKFTTTEGEEFALMHYQDCCENVDVDDIDGDLSDLVGSPILVAEERHNTQYKARDDYAESWTWTYYYLATQKGGCLIKFYGTSNGYYSEGVSFCKL